MKKRAYWLFEEDFSGFQRQPAATQLEKSHRTIINESAQTSKYLPKILIYNFLHYFIKYKHQPSSKATQQQEDASLLISGLQGLFGKGQPAVL